MVSGFHPSIRLVEYFSNDGAFLLISVGWWYVSFIGWMVVQFSDKVMEYFLKWGDGVFLLRYGGGKHLWVVVYFFRLSGGIFLS